MREIKFRLWHIKSKEMFYSSLATMNILIGLDGSIKDVYIKEDITSEFVKLQFTGLKDKNGKEIYEGDIVKLWECFDEDEPELNEFELSEVKYCAEESDYPAFEIKSNYFYESNILQAGVIEGRIEVIGNIYENPELLEEK